MKKHILNLLPNEIEEIMSSFCDKKYRISQVIDWVFKKFCSDFNLFTNISKELQFTLSETFFFSLPTILNESNSSDGTTKFLLELEDKNKIEMVIIPFKNKTTLCISSQVGCIRDCQFCATAKIGFIRNLEVYEILSQYFIAQQLLKDQRITNIVFMGMGEPLDNYFNVVKTIKILEAEKGFSFSGRKITISTCGVVPNIYKIINENRQNNKEWNTGADYENPA
jgi:23S rRNA (adenine2503-C2)-methyltransferase